MESNCVIKARPDRRDCVERCAKVCGQSPAIRDVVSLLETVPADSPLLSVKGTVRNGSARDHEAAGAPNADGQAHCAAIQRVMESEVFGHERERSQRRYSETGSSSWPTAARFSG